MWNQGYNPYERKSSWWKEYTECHDDVFCLLLVCIHLLYTLADTARYAWHMTCDTLFGNIYEYTPIGVAISKHVLVWNCPHICGYVHTPVSITTYMCVCPHSHMCGNYHTCVVMPVFLLSSAWATGALPHLSTIGYSIRRRSLPPPYLTSLQWVYTPYPLYHDPWPFIIDH